MTANRLKATAIISLAVAMSIGGIAGAQTPVVPDGGIKHVLQVLDRQGTSPAPDGVIVRFHRLLTPQEAASLQGRTLQLCGEVTVRAGLAEIVPEFTSDCPEGSRIGTTVDFRDGRPPIAAEEIPPIEWRARRIGEGPRTVIIKPGQPRTAGSADGIQTPASGEASLRSEESPAFPWGYAALGASVVLALSSVLLALLNRRRPAG